MIRNLIAICIAILLTGFALGEDLELTKESFEHQLDYQAGIYPGMIPNPEYPGSLMPAKGQFDHPEETEALWKIQLLPYNGDGYVENGVQKHYDTPLEPAYPPNKQWIHLGQQEPQNSTSIGLLNELGCLPDSFTGKSMMLVKVIPLGENPLDRPA